MNRYVHSGTAAVMCKDETSLQTLRSVLVRLGIDAVACASREEAMEQILGKRCTALIVDFDLPGAAEVAKLTHLLEPQRKPVLLAMSASWPGSGEASQSGANRILYKPLEAAQINDAFETTRKGVRRDGRKAERHAITSVIWLDLESGTVPAVALNLSEQGMAIRTTMPLRVQTNVSFRCTLPGTSEQLHGLAEVIWSDAGGRAGMFFSRLAPSARKRLKCWLKKHGANSPSGKDTVRGLLRPFEA